MRLFKNIPSLLPPLIAANLFTHMALSGGRVGGSLYALHEGCSELVIGLLIGIYGVLPMVFALKIGRWIDRVGPFVPMRNGVVCTFVGALFPVIVPHVASLFVTAVLCGVGFSIVSLSAQYTVGQLHQQSTASRAANFGWLSLGQSASAALGPVIVGIAIDSMGYKAAFAVLSLCAGIALFVVTPCKMALSRMHEVTPQQERRNIWTLLSNPSVRRICILGILLAVSWDLFTFLMPILGYRRSLTASAISTTLAAFATGTFVIRLAMQRLARRFNEWQILRAAMIVIIVVYVALPFAQSVPLYLLLSFMLGIAVGCSQPNLLSLLYTHAPPGRGAEAVGLRTTLANASGVFVPFLFGATATSAGLMPVFLAVAALITLALPIAHRQIESSYP